MPRPLQSLGSLLLAVDQLSVENTRGKAQQHQLPQSVEGKLRKSFLRKAFGMSWCHRAILICSVLLVASIQAVRGADLRRIFPTAAPSEVEGSENTLTPLEWSQNKSSFSGGVLWNIYQEDSASSVIPSDVHCKKDGLNPIPGSCQKFMYCKDLSGEGDADWYILLFTCPEGQVFEDASGKCRHLSSVEWSPECHSDSRDHVSEKALIHNRLVDEEDLTKQSTLTTSNSTSEEKHPGTLKDSSKQDDDCDDDESAACGVPGKDELSKNGTVVTSANADQEIELPSLGITRQNNGSVRDNTSDFSDQNDVQERKKRSSNVVDIIAQDAVEVCNDMRNINRYVAHVRSTNTLHFTHKEDFFVDILNVYNKNLEFARTNTKSWDQRKGIQEAITEVFNLAREFGPELRKRFQNMKTSIDTIPKTDQNFEEHRIRMNQLQKDINVMETKIKAFAHMKPIVEPLQQLLELKRSELGNLIGNGKFQQFKKLTEIIKYVIDKSIEIQSKSSNVVRRLEAFHQKIYQDSSKFHYTISKVEMGTNATKETTKKTQRDIDDHKNKLVDAQTKVEQTKHMLEIYRRQLVETRMHITKHMRELEEHARRNRDMAIVGGALFLIPVFGWITGGILVGVGLTEKNRALKSLEEAKINLEQTTKNYLKNLEYFSNVVETEKQIINKLESTIKTFGSRLENLQKIRGSLQKMESSAKSIEPFITKALSVLGGLKDVFSSVEDDLVEMKDKVNEAHSKAEKGEGSYFRYEAVVVKQAQDPWENAKNKIISVGKCV